jgi:hypothetical protein
MASIDSYDYYDDAIAPWKRSLNSESTITIVVNPRNESVHTTFHPQDPPADPNPDVASICCQSLRCIITLMRLTFTLFFMPFTPAIRLCRSLKRWFLQWLLDNMQQRARWFRVVLNSQVRTRWPKLWRTMSRIILLPLQIVHAIITCQEATCRPPVETAVETNPIRFDDHFDSVVTIKFMKRYPGSTTEHKYLEKPLSIPPSLPLGHLDDLPTLEGRSTPTSKGNRLLDSRPYSGNPFESTEHFQRGNIAPEDSPQQEMQPFGPCESRGSATPRLPPCDGTARMTEDVQQSSVDQVQSPEACSDGNISPIQKSKTAQFCNVGSHHLPATPENCKDDAATADCNRSSISSDPAHDESFSPEQFPLPDINRKEPLFGSWTITNSSSQRGHEVELPSPSSTSPEPRLDRPSTVLGSVSSSSAQGETQLVTERPQNFQRLSGVQSACGGSPLQHDDTEYCPSETTSCCERPYMPTRRISGQQRFEADECYETCISCQTCDRRHNRAPRSSKIPRRVKTFEHSHRRSSSFTSYHSAQSAGSASTVVKRKLQKRKVKAY